LTEQQGRVLGGRYRLTAHLGTGSSAQVFLAEDVALRRRVAVKVLHPALADDESFLRRFRAEARAAAALSHPNLMAVFDWGEDDGPYLILEFLGGGSLRAMLDTGARLSLPQVVAVGLEATRALDAAHRRGFVHRDIKPANLLFGDDGRLRIADFGLARALSEAAWTEPGDGLVGTARYAAPEQATSPRIDGRADVYSLGLVLIEAVTGRVPLTADTALGTLMRRVDAPVPVPDELGRLGPVLAQVGQVDPDARPDAAELVRALTTLERSLDRPEPLALAGALAGSSPSVDPTLVPGSVLGSSPVAPPAVPPGRPPDGSAEGDERPGRSGDPVVDGGAPPATATSATGPASWRWAHPAPRCSTTSPATRSSRPASRWPVSRHPTGRDPAGRDPAGSRRWWSTTPSGPHRWRSPIRHGAGPGGTAGARACGRGSWSSSRSWWWPPRRRAPGSWREASTVGPTSGRPRCRRCRTSPEPTPRRSSSPLPLRSTRVRPGRRRR
jgi:serine/threonine protein kinase